MTADLIVDFPQQRNSRAVHFAKTAQQLVFERPEVARHELSYTKAEYVQMKRVIRQDVLEARSASTPREAVDDDTSSTQAEEGVCSMGIEHLLTPACIKEVRTCRAQCIQAVLAEQARQGLSSSGSVWDAIALASFAQTMQTTLRARLLGELHNKSHLL